MVDDGDDHAGSATTFQPRLRGRHGDIGEKSAALIRQDAAQMLAA